MYVQEYLQCYSLVNIYSLYLHIYHLLLQVITLIKQGLTRFTTFCYTHRLVSHDLVCTIREVARVKQNGI